MGKTCQTCPKLAGAIVISILIFTWLFWGRTGEYVHHHAPVVLVVVLERIDTSTKEEVRILDKVLENRGDYAAAHGNT
jgi:hypothetical protein